MLHKFESGFTLMELLVVMGLLGVLATLAIPAYNGYTDTARVSMVQNNLRAIYLKEQDYFTSNAVFYASGGTCGNHRAAINTNLFAGTQVLADDGFNYCILQSDTDEFTARAEEQGGSRTFTINQTNTANF